MVAEQALPDITYKGSAAEKKLAEQIFEAVRAHGMFSSDYVAIRVKTESLAEFLDTTPDKIQAAAEKNEQVFAIETIDDFTYVVTTRLGTPPIAVNPDIRHSFAARFMTPEPAPERPLRTEKPIPEVVINAEVAHELEDSEEEATSVDDELRTEEGIETGPTARDSDVTVEIVSSEAAEPDVQEITEEPVAEAPPVGDETAEDIAVPAPAPEEQLAPEVEEEPAPQTEATDQLTDLAGVDDAAVAEAITAALRGDNRVANFGDAWMAEDRVQRLSRGNLRSLADYINEQEQPLTDDMLVQDVLGARRSSSDFALTRFSMNYRLSSERNFEFLGTTDQPFWGTTDLPPIGTTRRKASDIGTDYRYLIDEVPAGSVGPRSVTSVEHTLSFYEFTYGLLPLGEKMQALLPAPVMPDQRSAVLTFEIPQFENSIYLVEVRYPTPNRGGFILGLDDFYDEKLVPGAMLSIEATDNNGHYKIEYLEDDEQQDRFLELDDRRAAKYVFRPLTYDTAVASDWMVTENRFPRFGSEKPLSEKKRRRIEDVVEESFKRIGEEDGSTLSATFTDLLVAVNVERPASDAYLRSAIESMASISDDGSGILTYDTSA